MDFRTEASEEYQKALRAGTRNHRQCVHSGTYPFLQILDEILPAYKTVGVVELGLIDIPMDKIVGTKTRGRTNAFAANFMPLMPENSEFGMKWSMLCQAHLSDTGIRDPITCYEFLGKFYVQEGNKRVSVLKHFGARSVMGNVVRIQPAESTDKEVLAYRDFLTYFPMTRLYQVYFTKVGSFPALQAAMGYGEDHAWSDDERRRYLSGYYIFSEAFEKLGGNKLPITVADAMLEWLKVYPFGQIREMSSQQLLRSLEAMWPQIKAIGSSVPIKLHTQDSACEQKNYKNRRVFSMMPSYLNIAFIHELKKEASNWVNAHDEGSRYLEEVLGDQVIIQRFFGVGVGEMAERAMEIAIKNGAELIFATTASLITACRRVSARHPQVKIFNCSVYMPYTDIRTYYSRIYEAKFISGAIAGAISQTDDIGYIASYPIYGVSAGINAFALGAQLTRPYARVHLKWSCTHGDPLRELQEENVHVISSLDIPQQNCEDGQWGTFTVSKDGSSQLIASPYWNWGAFYEQIARGILSKGWESGILGNHQDQAVNYWWGFASDVIGFRYTDHLPVGTRKFAEFLQDQMKNRKLDLFQRMIVDQNGAIRNDGTKTFTSNEILQMDWMCENVIGSFPDFESLTDKGQGICRLQGLFRDQISPQSAINCI